MSLNVKTLVVRDNEEIPRKRDDCTICSTPTDMYIFSGKDAVINTRYFGDLWVFNCMYNCISFVFVYPFAIV